MTAVEVAKLKLRCGAGQSDRTRFAIEDALRTTIADDRRLTLLRSMRVAAGASSASPARRQEAVRAGWLAAVAGARHGGEDGAESANCVWFESREEAETLLLSRLLEGRRVDGWYWKLAVPDWQGRPLPLWLSVSLSRALASSRDEQVLAIARCCVAAGQTERLVEALADPPPDMAAPAFGGWEAAANPGRIQAATSAAADGATAPAESPMPLPPELRRAVVRLLAAGGDGPAVARAIVRAWIRRRSPALALAPAVLADTIAATLADIAPVPAHSRWTGSPGRSALPPVSEPIASRHQKRAPAPEPVRLPEASRTIVSETALALEAPSTARPPIPLADPEQGGRPAPRQSPHAGLWLVLPSLVRLGFREWLAERPALLADHPGRLLMHAIARHYRIGADDPALAVLGAPPAIGAFPEWSVRWRHGLDRWLRRTVRRRLHDLVNRPGGLDWGEWRLDILYPAGDADIALRRCALDRDPGWTDWLGLSIRYHFGGAEERP